MVDVTSAAPKSDKHMPDKHKPAGSNNLNAMVLVKKPIKPQVVYIGELKTPVIVIDDFTADVSELQACASQIDFNLDMGSYYPGVRAKLPKDYVIEVLNHIFQLIYDVYKVPTNLRIKPQATYFSLINRQPESLTTLQRIPHFDTPAPYYFAILQYLNDQPHGATAFFKHKPSGFERITQQNMQQYFNAAEPYLQQIAPKPAKYFVESNAYYQQHHQIEYKQHRLVIYPGNLLHSTLVNLDTDIDSNPDTGRLTANIFINIE
ncbi:MULTISPECIES: DUF6445 family protein [unclassified Shewanella]|uniref:DUF6445 family protein n=1 Tax=unclassified Shewanella TaxID=196818 RepID=UPI001F537804|nr:MULTISPECIES: DUF6445 family protein [unclassified Shewanella]MDO6619583.1 DUF6445 family protein [Shewanella sp. 6_MG-2023]MDO6680237.1 DUF6445 family protein [Shewanella sp. 4_MG-2023]